MMENNLLEVFFPKLRGPCSFDTGGSNTVTTEDTGSTMGVSEQSPDNLLEVFFPKMYKPYMCDNGRSSSVVQASGLMMADADPSPSGVETKKWAAAEEATWEIIRKVHPTSASEERRSSVTKFVQRLIRDHLGFEVLPFGSVPLKTYIPDGDMDFTVFCGGNEDLLAVAAKVKAVLQEAGRNVTSEFVIRDVQVIPAEVKLVKCMVQNIAVDISFNQIGGLRTLCFLEETDRLICKDHLFKRSIMLIKSWAYYESRILGAQYHLISTYALETLVLHVINLYHSTLYGPLAVLKVFLDYFSTFDWATFCVSANGPVDLASLPGIINVCSVPSRGGDMKFSEFLKKHLNIIDPLRPANNLGRSVSKGNLYRIRSAFTYGAERLSRILSQPENCIASELNKFFSNTLAWQESRCRPDVSLAGSRFRDFGSPLLSKKVVACENLNFLIDLSGDFERFHEWLDHGRCPKDNALRSHASHMLSTPTTLYQNTSLQLKEQDSACHSHDELSAPTVCGMQGTISPDHVSGLKDIELERGTRTAISELNELVPMIPWKWKETGVPCTIVIRNGASSPGSLCSFKPHFVVE